jgi:hypothetical protein
MARGARAGNTVEVRCAEILQDEGWVVGSRRHIGGPGDLLAVILDGDVQAFDHDGSPIAFAEIKLIEVKSTAKSAYERYGRKARAELLEMATSIGAEAELWWWPPRRPEPMRIRSAMWPK